MALKRREAVPQEGQRSYVKVDTRLGVYPRIDGVARQTDEGLRGVETRSQEALRGKVDLGAYDVKIADLEASGAELRAENAALKDVVYRQEETLRLIATSLRDPKVSGNVTNLTRYTREKLGDKPVEKPKA